MKKGLFIPHAYFANIKRVAELLYETGNKSHSAKDLSEKLNFSPNYIFQTTRTMTAFKLLDNIGRTYILSNNGCLFLEYLQKHDTEKIKKLGEDILLNNPDTKIFRIAYDKLRLNPKITDYDLGNFISDELKLNSKSQFFYQRVGSSCKSILKGFNLIGEQKDSKLDTIYESTKNKTNEDILAYLHKDVNTFILFVSENENSWKNHIDLKQKIIKNFDELINRQYETATKDFLELSKAVLQEGFNNKNINLIRLSRNTLIKIERDNLLK